MCNYYVGEEDKGKFDGRRRRLWFRSLRECEQLQGRRGVRRGGLAVTTPGFPLVFFFASTCAKRCVERTYGNCNSSASRRVRSSICLFSRIGGGGGGHVRDFVLPSSPSVFVNVFVDLTS